ncbi:MAG: hypothetical protein AABO58_16235 [Acidobacteriota bacterium]
MGKKITLLPALLLLVAACGPVTSRAPIQTTPDEVNACATVLLGSMGYRIVDDDPLLRADYDRVTVAVIADELRVRGETVVMSGGERFASTRNRMASSAGGTMPTSPSRELRADVKRIALECGGS